MPIKMPDYLADLQTQFPQRPPLEILHEAAERLKDQTGGLVEGLVSILNPGGANLFRYTFYLLAPRLNDYTDPLFYAWHDDRLYPVNVMLAGGKMGTDDKSVSTETQLEEELQKIFDGDTARRRVQALIATARS
jgi:hypothetical protein